MGALGPGFTAGLSGVKLIQMIDTCLIIYIILTRIFELFLSNKNTERLLQEGATEYYKSHYKFIVFFHIIFLSFFFIKSLSNTIINIEYLYIFSLFKY